MYITPRLVTPAPAAADLPHATSDAPAAPVRRRRHRPLRVAAAIALVTLAACGTSDGADESTSVITTIASIGGGSAPALTTAASGGGDGGAGGATTSGVDGASTSVEGASDAVPDHSPLMRLAGYELDPAEVERNHLAVEDAITRCMSERGWSYTARPFVDPSALGRGDGLTADEVAARYGYGIVQHFRTGGTTGTGPAVAAPGAPPEPVDPNAAYVSSLSDVQRAAYDRDLNGDNISDQQSCRGQAIAAEPSPAADEPFREAVFAALEATDGHPRVVAAEDAWRICMGDAIVDLRDLDQAPVDSPLEMTAAIQNLLYDAQGIRIVQNGTESPDTEGEPRPVTAGELDALQERELRLFQDDQRCQADSRVRQIRFEVETEAVELILREYPQYRG